MSGSDALERYAERHETESVAFAATLLERAGRPELAEADGVGKREFARRIRRSQR